MNQNNVVNPSYADIDQCANSEEGQNMLHDFGVKTKALDPPLNWVPWILVNDVYVEEDFQPLQDDFKGVLCRKYLTTVPECSDYTTTTTTSTTSGIIGINIACNSLLMTCLFLAKKFQ